MRRFAERGIHWRQSRPIEDCETSVAAIRSSGFRLSPTPSSHAPRGGSSVDFGSTREPPCHEQPPRPHRCCTPQLSLLLASRSLPRLSPRRCPARGRSFPFDASWRFHLGERAPGCAARLRRHFLAVLDVPTTGALKAPSTRLRTERKMVAFSRTDRVVPEEFRTSRFYLWQGRSSSSLTGYT